MTHIVEHPDKNGSQLEMGDRIVRDIAADEDNKPTVGAVVGFAQPGVVRIMWKTYNGKGLETVEYSRSLEREV